MMKTYKYITKNIPISACDIQFEHSSKTTMSQSGINGALVYVVSRQAYPYYNCLMYVAF